jgi:hypothetical protein
MGYLRETFHLLDFVQFGGLGDFQVHATGERAAVRRAPAWASFSEASIRGTHDYGYLIPNKIIPLSRQSPTLGHAGRANRPRRQPWRIDGGETIIPPRVRRQHAPVLVERDGVPGQTVAEPAGFFRTLV